MLREVRERSGLAQVELARRAGIPASVLSAYERGHRQPGADVFLRIIEAAGFETRLVPRLDDRVQGERLVQVLRLAEALPYRPRPMASPQWRAS